MITTIFLGKTIGESSFDIEAVAECCNYFSSLCYTLEGQHVPISGDAFGYTIREPLGVCGGKEKNFLGDLCESLKGYREICL